MGSSRVLLVEDEDKLRRVLALQLEDSGFTVVAVSSAEAGLPLLDEVQIAFTDLRLPGISGFEFLERARRRHPHLPVVVITAFGSIETAVEAMKQGAFDFLEKPFSLDHFTAVAVKAAEYVKLQTENRQLREELAGRYQFDNIIGRSPGMQEIFKTVVRVAGSRATVLIAGESGTGKDMIARAVHYHSPRRDRPFVKIDCTALPENLMESELFGYEKGAFTGASQARAGKFEAADTGTVFLDEIGDVPPQIQVKLLRVLQERAFERLGANKTRTIDVRVIAATNVDLRRALEQGTFREDLFYRLNVVPINVPPLRERKVDIPYLADHFIGKHAGPNGSPVRRIAAAAIDKLMGYSWPGNVRELENVMERSIVLAGAEELKAEDIHLDPPRREAGGAGSGFLPEGMTLDQYEESLIREAMRRAANNKSQAARLLGITRNALRYRLAQIGMEGENGE